MQIYVEVIKHDSEMKIFSCLIVWPMTQKSNESDGENIYIDYIGHNCFAFVFFKIMINDICA